MGLLKNIGRWAGRAAGDVGDWTVTAAEDVGEAIADAASAGVKWTGRTAENLFDWTADNPEWALGIAGMFAGGPVYAVIAFRMGQKIDDGAQPGEVVATGLETWALAAGVAAVLATGGGATPAVVGALSGTAALAKGTAHLSRTGQVRKEDLARTSAAIARVGTDPEAEAYLSEAAALADGYADAAEAAAAMQDLLDDAASDTPSTGSAGATAATPAPAPHPQPSYAGGYAFGGQPPVQQASAHAGYVF